MPRLRGIAVLFSSYIFIFAFLPVTLGVFFVLAKYAGARASALWLTLASLFFYSWWNPMYLVLILVSIVVNYGLGVAIHRGKEGTHNVSPRLILVLGIVFNLLLLGYFKYVHFFGTIFDSVTRLGWTFPVVVLPLAISFFTFTQIAYLVDTYRGVTESHDFLYYALFVSFFPHLIAGPIVSYGRLMPQFARKENYRLNPDHFAQGLGFFIVGLSKKVLIADNLSPLASIGFGQETASVLDAWLGVLGYTFQLYFDFSGYSDMAIGLAWMFNIQFPLNFNSPYKATDIADFWQRWHITLSHFLRDYLYIPLGGNRHGEVHRYMNLMITMLLAGLWHGASWTFLIWGALHGFYMVIFRVYQYFAQGAAWRERRWVGMSSRALTFFAVMFGWVFFRSPSVKSALLLLLQMFGVGYADATRLTLWHLTNVAVLTVAGIIVFFAPNAHAMFRIAEPPGKSVVDSPPEANPLWLVSTRWAYVLAFLLTACVLSMATGVGEFLYFRF